MVLHYHYHEDQQRRISCLTIRNFLAPNYGVHVADDIHIYGITPKSSAKLHTWQHEQEYLVWNEQDSRKDMMTQRNLLMNTGLMMDVIKARGSVVDGDKM